MFRRSPRGRRVRATRVTEPRRLAPGRNLAGRHGRRTLPGWASLVGSPWSVGCRARDALWDAEVSRIGSAGATWLAVLLLARRIGGPLPLVAAFAGVCAVALVWSPAAGRCPRVPWLPPSSYGLLGMVMTRPSPGCARSGRPSWLRRSEPPVRSVVTGYDVALRPYRFRMMVLALTLLAALALARRLGMGFRSLGRRGLVLIVAAVLILVLAVGYVQAVRHWGSSGVAGSLR